MSRFEFVAVLGLSPWLDFSVSKLRQTLDLPAILRPTRGVSIITLTTDFGAGSRYVAQLKGVLMSRAAAEVSLVDLSHAIAPQDIASAARLLADSSHWYPVGTVHLAVVDPGVGTDRPIVAVESKGQRYVAPDNGLLGWIDPIEIDQMVEVESDKFLPAGNSSTFHGRDRMAPAAALLASGAKLSDLGKPHTRLQQVKTMPEPVQKSDRIEGQVVEVDNYGNLITNISAEMLASIPHDESLVVACGEHKTFGLWRTYADQPAQTLIALIGSTTMLELAITNGNAAEMLDAKAGATVEVTWAT